MRTWLEVRVPFFRPLWRRWAAFGAAAAWAILEILGGSPFWSILSLAAAAYLGWAFFIAFEDGPAD